MDLFSYFLSFTARIAIGIGTLIGALLNILFLGAARSSNSSTATSTKLTKAQKSEEAENERLAGCRDVVLEFARVLGSVAREGISRDELEQLIDDGDSAGGLCSGNQPPDCCHARQPGRSFNFREAMDEGKILLFNLSDGVLGEQTAQLLEQLVVSKIQMAVMNGDCERSGKRGVERCCVLSQLRG